MATQGAKKVSFTEHVLAQKSFQLAWKKSDCSSSVIWIPQKNHLPIGQVKKRIHWPNSKIH